MKKSICVVIVILSISFVYGIKKEIRDEESKIRVIGYDGKQDGIISELLENFLRCIRRLFVEGDEISGFPSLQKIDMGDFLVNETNDWFNLKTDVSNFVLYGLGNFTINHVDLNLIGLIFDYDLEFHLTTSGKYANCDLKMMNIINIYGDGDLNLEMVLNPLGNAKLNLNTTKPEWIIEVLEYYGFFLIKPNFNITGINHDEVLSSAISKQMSMLIEQLVGESAEAVSAQLSPIIKYILNKWIPDPDSFFNKLLNLALDTCLDTKFFLEMLHEEAIKQEFVQNVV